MNKIVTDLTLAELEKVFNKNSHLREVVKKEMLNSYLHLANEVVQHIKPSLKDWHIGTKELYFVPDLSLESKKQFLDGFCAILRGYRVMPEIEAVEMSFQIESYLNVFNKAGIETDEEEIANKLDEAITSAANLLAENLGRLIDECFNVDSQRIHFIHNYTEECFYVDSEYNVLVENEGVETYE